MPKIVVITFLAHIAHPNCFPSFRHSDGSWEALMYLCTVAPVLADESASTEDGGMMELHSPLNY